MALPSDQLTRGCMAETKKTYDEDDAVCVDCIEDEALRELVLAEGKKQLYGTQLDFKDGIAASSRCFTKNGNIAPKLMLMNDAVIAK